MGDIGGDLRLAAKDKDVVFLVPSNRDKGLLRDILAGGEMDGRPPMWIWDDLYRGLVEACPPRKVRVQIDPPDHWLLLRFVVSRLREEAGAAMPEGTGSPAFLGLAGEAVRELLREDVPREELAAAIGCPGCPSERCPNLADEAGLLCRLYGDYQSLLDREGLADSAQIPALGERLLREAPQGRAWAATLRLRAVGFLSFASGQLRLLRGLAEAGADLELWVPTCGEGDFYTALDQFPEATVVPATESAERRPFVAIAAGDRCLSTDTLARELVLWSLGEGFLPSATGMDFPGWDAIAASGGPDDAASAAESFDRYGVPFSMQDGLPFSETMLWTSALRARDLTGERWPARETADLLSGLLFAPFTFPRTAFAGRLPAGRTEWSAFLAEHPAASGSAAFARALRFTDRIAGGGRPEELLDALRDLAPGREEWKAILPRIAEYPALDRSMRSVVLAAQEAGDKADALRDLRRDLGDAGRAVLSGDEAMAFLAQWADTGTIWRESPLSPAVALHPGNPPVLASAAVWILLGATGKQWPGQVRQSPLLDDERRRALHENPALGLGRSHLPLVPEKRLQREALFRRLTAGGEDLCILVRPLSDENGRPLPPSPFAETLAGGPRPWFLQATEELRRPLGELLSPGGTAVIDGVEYGEREGHPLGLSRGNPAAVPLPLPGERAFPLSALDDYAACAFFFYCRYVSGIEPPCEDRFRPDLAGNAVHKLWQIAWEERIESGRPLSAVTPDLFESVATREYAALLFDPRLERHRERLREQVRALAHLQDEMDGVLAGLRDGQSREEPLPDFAVDGLPCRGRCDRMDLLSDGRALLFDYKSGAKDRLRGSLQLPAYALALERAGRPVAGWGYLTLKDSGVTGAVHEDLKATLAPWKFAGNLDDRKNSALEALQRTARSFASGLFPPNYDSPQCRWCPYPALCRRGDFRAPDEEEDGDEQ